MHRLKQNHAAEELNRNGFFFQSVSKVGEFLTVPCKTAMYLPNTSFARPETDVTKAAWAA